MSNPVDGADRLAEREYRAGGPAAIVQSLIDGLAREARYIRWTAIGLMLDVVLSIILGLVVYSEQRTAHQAVKNTISIAASCRTGNDFRVTERSLWKYVISQRPPLGLTAQQLAARAKQGQAIRARVDRAFKLRICPK